MFFRIILAADGTVSSRVVNLTFDDGTNVLARVAVPASITAGQTSALTFGMALSFQNNSTVLNQNIPLGNDLYLFQGYKIKTVTQNLQAGDDFGAPVYYVEEWIEE